ncbi:MAG TPA: hypothetical protein VIK89_00180 [Cytophagaceae bacterium]
MPRVRIGNFWSVWIYLSIILVVAIYVKPRRMVTDGMEAAVVKSSYEKKGFPRYTPAKLDFLLEYNYFKELLNL